MSEEKENRDWSFITRNLWWIRYAVVIAALWGVNRGFNEWISTRASIAYVDQQISTRESVEAAKEMKAKVERNIEVTSNIRDNLIIIMDRQNIKPMPLPDRGK